VALTLHIYDSAGIEVFSAPAGNSVAPLGGLNASQDPWDPATGALILSDGAWSFSYAGLDHNGTVLRNGVYLFVVEMQSGGSVQKQLRVLGAGAGRVALNAGPNPLRPGPGSVSISWSPALAVELKVFALDGSLVRDFGTVPLPPVAWDLRSSGGGLVANGIYVITGRVPGERSPQTFKLLLAR
jgi:hypothetical protein